MQLSLTVWERRRHKHLPSRIPLSYCHYYGGDLGNWQIENMDTILANVGKTERMLGFEGHETDSMHLDLTNPMVPIWPMLFIRLGVMDRVKMSLKQPGPDRTDTGSHKTVELQLLYDSRSTSTYNTDM